MVLIILYNKYSDDYTEEILEEDILIHHQVLLEKGDYKPVRRNIQQEVENLIDFRGGGGSISLADFYTDLKLDTKEEKAACRMSLNRLSSRGKIEKIEAGKTGTYRLIKKDVEKTQFVKGAKEGRLFPIKLPFELNDLCQIHPKSIIILAGSKSAGKTATLLNIAIMNQNQHDIDYFNSDMGDEEFTDRMIDMGCVCPEDVKFNVFHRSSNFQDLITQEKKIFIIDFMEVHDEFWKVAQPIKQIWDKLRDGVAVIALQMKQGAKLARGGDFTLEKARLYLAMNYQEDQKCTRIKIEEAKTPTPAHKENGVRGWWCDVKIINGASFRFVNKWNGYEIEKARKDAFRRTF